MGRCGGNFEGCGGPAFCGPVAAPCGPIGGPCGGGYYDNAYGNTGYNGAYNGAVGSAGYGATNNNMVGKNREVYYEKENCFAANNNNCFGGANYANAAGWNSGCNSYGVNNGGFGGGWGPACGPVAWGRGGWSGAPRNVRL